MQELDPVEFVILYLESQPDIPDDSATGDLNTREAGDTTIHLNDSGGFRYVRDAADRVDIEYDVYHIDRGEAKALANRVRRLLLEEFRGELVGGAEILDVEEIARPSYYPDHTSREHVYGGEVTVFYVDA